MRTAQPQPQPLGTVRQSFTISKGNRILPTNKHVLQQESSSAHTTKSVLTARARLQWVVIPVVITKGGLLYGWPMVSQMTWCTSEPQQHTAMSADDTTRIGRQKAMHGMILQMSFAVNHPRTSSTSEATARPEIMPACYGMCNIPRWMND